MPFFCIKGFIREPKPPKKGIRVLLGIPGLLAGQRFRGLGGLALGVLSCALEDRPGSPPKTVAAGLRPVYTVPGLYMIDLNREEFIEFLNGAAMPGS